MKNTFVALFVTFLFLSLSCNLKSQTENAGKTITKDSIITEDNIEEVVIEEEEDYQFQFETDPVYTYGCDEFSRDSIKLGLKKRIAEGKPLYVHIFVPLCDNENQGIVPTSKAFGDGLSLKTNLYWGAGYGMRTHFKRKKAWKLLSAKQDIDNNILERLVFVKKFPNKANVYLTIDAYRGDRMKECLVDYFDALSYKSVETYNTGKDTVLIRSNADLLILNGHNGLMDTGVTGVLNTTNNYKDAAVIACDSHSYFAERFKCTKSYPLVTTVSLLGPEAYVAHGIIDAWATLKTEEQIRLSAGDAMYYIFKRHQKGMRRMFKTGW